MRKMQKGPGGRVRKACLVAGAILLLGACAKEMEDWSGPADPIVEPIGVLGSMQATPLTIQAAGETSLIEVEVIGLDGQPASDVEVSFVADLGSITGTATSDAQGVARAVFTAGDVPGLARIVAAIPGSERGLTVLVGEGTLASEPASVLADGVETCQVSGFVPAERGGSPAGRRVRFAASAGALTVTEAVADSSGWVSTGLVSVPSMVDVGAAVTMTDADDPNLVLGGTMVVMRGVTVELSAASEVLPADGVSQTTLRAVLQETSAGVAVTGATVSFAADHGTVSASDTTDASGAAEAIYTSPTSPGVAVARATFAGSVSDSVSLTISNVSLTLASAADTLAADGSSTTVLTAWLGNPVTQEPMPGEDVRFTATLGEIDTLATTDGNGEARATLRVGVRTGTCRVEVSYLGEIRATYIVELIPLTVAGVWLSVEPSRLVADGESSLTARAVVSLGEGAPAPEGTEVRFTSGAGIITPSAYTEGGVARATLTSSAELGLDIPVIARVGGMADTARVDFIAGPAEVLWLTVDEDTLPADGLSTALLTAHVEDGTGNPVENGTRVHFYADLGWVTESELTLGGTVEAGFTAATDAGKATVRAEVYPALEDTIRGQVGIHLISGEPGDIVLSTDRLSVGVAGVGEVETSDIEAWVKDKNGNPVPDGTEVSFEIILGPGGGEHLDSPAVGYGPLLVPTTGGMARTTLKSGTVAGVVNVEARAGAAVHSGAQVVIESGPPAQVIVSLTHGASHLDEQACEWYRLVTTMVMDQYHNPVEDSTAVYFTLSPGARAMVEGTSATGILEPHPYGPLWPLLEPLHGVAYSWLMYTSENVFDSYSLIARTAGGTQEVTDSLSMTNLVIEPELLALASPAVVDTVNGGNCAISAVLRDMCGWYIDGGVIDFTVDNAQVTLLPDWAVTDGSGWAQVMLIVPPGMEATTITVTARLRSSGVTAIATVEVQ